jgi:antitoxin (DNA-binding transcriptional repressor) of toxin-antitoxin stability system
MKYTVSEARRGLSRLLKAACAGNEVVVAGGKGFLVKLVPIQATEVPNVPDKDRVPGALKGRILYTADAFAPLTDEELSDLGFE